jgi:hypothetical protein
MIKKIIWIIQEIIGYIQKLEKTLYNAKIWRILVMMK